MSHIYTGWPLSEIKAMSVRERTFWIALNRWRTDKQMLDKRHA